MSYHCIKSDCQKRGQTSSIKRNFRCANCEPQRTDASHYIVPLASAYESSSQDSSPSRSSYDSGSSYSSDSGSSSSDSSNSFSGGGGDSGGGGASGSFGSD